MAVRYPVMTSADQQVEVKKGHEVSLWASIGAARTVVVGGPGWSIFPEWLCARRGQPLERTEPGCEMPQKLRLGDDFESADAVLSLVHFQDRFHQIIDVALRIDAARYCQAQ